MEKQQRDPLPIKVETEDSLARLSPDLHAHAVTYTHAHMHVHITYIQNILKLWLTIKNYYTLLHLLNLFYEEETRAVARPGRPEDNLSILSLPRGSLGSNPGC